MDDNESQPEIFNDCIDEITAPAAVNSTILDYYKKFGRKRDLEQFFSLSTAASEVRDPTSLFWRRMKALDSSDEKKSDSSTEVCRISIKCSIPEPTSSKEDKLPKLESDSPPIINEDIVLAEPSNDSDDESIKSDDNHSQKSADATFDTSMNKPLSPTSSATSQRKLEWDSLADVGYANESDRKTSGSSLSTLERLALKQQYSYNDSKNINVGNPTAHSTPVEDTEGKTKNKKSSNKKTTKIYKKDFLELNVAQNSQAKTASGINFNLTKHISFNVEKDDVITVEKITKDISVAPKTASVETEMTPQVKMDKEIQTSLLKTNDKSSTAYETAKVPSSNSNVPVTLSLNTLRKRQKKKRTKNVNKKMKSKKTNKYNIQNFHHEKSGEPVSEAESFEYMPGHMYNQNRLKEISSKSGNQVGNKSSLESSGVRTTDSSKGSKHSFSKDLERAINGLCQALHRKHSNSELKEKLVKEVVERLVNAKYRDDDSTTDFLSGLSFKSKNIGLPESNYTTTSTSEANDTVNREKVSKPKKSILRTDRFNANAIASTSQSAPNLPTVINSETPVFSYLSKALIAAKTDSDENGNSSDTAFAKTSSEELYYKYLKALSKEEAYRRHLKDKELFLRHKLVSSESAFNISNQINVKANRRLKELMRDLTRNNYDDGSGDASKLEGGYNPYVDEERYNVVKKQRSHSVFTMSSNSDTQNKKLNLRKRIENEIKGTAGPSNEKQYCHCQHPACTKAGVVDSSIQVNMELACCRESSNAEASCTNSKKCTDASRHVAHLVPDNISGDVKYVCLCTDKLTVPKDMSENVLIYKCSRLTHRGVQSDIMTRETTCENLGKQPLRMDEGEKQDNKRVEKNIVNQSSQTNMDLIMKFLKRKRKDRHHHSSSSAEKSSSQGSRKNDTQIESHDYKNPSEKNIEESTRFIQTGISIDPKISSPNMSDIVEINSDDCVKLVNQQSKPKTTTESKKSLSTSEQQTKSNLYSKSSQTSPKSPKSDHTNNFQKSVLKINKEVQYEPEIIDGKVSDAQIDNYAIPIQGTNMTLLVNFGKNDGQNQKNNDDVTEEHEISNSKPCPEENYKGEVGLSKDVKNENCVEHKSKSSKEVHCNDLESKGPCNSHYKGHGDIPTSNELNSAQNNRNVGHYYYQSPSVGYNNPYVSYQNSDFNKALYQNKNPGHMSNPCHIAGNNNPSHSFKQSGLSDPEYKINNGRFFHPNQNIQHSSNFVPDKETLRNPNFDQHCEAFSSKFPNTSNLCSKDAGVQFKGTANCNINSHASNIPFFKDHCPSKSKNESIQYSVKHFDRSTQCQIDPKSNTYPKTVKPIEKKTLVRSNTDTGTFSCKSRETSPRFRKEAELLIQGMTNTCAQDKKKTFTRARREKEIQSDVESRNQTLKQSHRPGSPMTRSKSPGLARSNSPSPVNSTRSRSPKSAQERSNSTKSGDNFHSAKSRGNTDKMTCSDRSCQSDVPCGSSKSLKNENVCGDTCGKPGRMKKNIDQHVPPSDKNDPVIAMIQDITKRYNKGDVVKGDRKKCFKEIMNVLNYLLDTEESSEHEVETSRNSPRPCQVKCTTKTEISCLHNMQPCGETVSPSCAQQNTQQICNTPRCNEPLINTCEIMKHKKMTSEIKMGCPKISQENSSSQTNVCQKQFVHKGIQSRTQRNTPCYDNHASTDMPCTSSDSATCYVLNRIRKECEKFHQKRCKCTGHSCETSNSTACMCKRQGYCRNNKCKCQKSKEKLKKKCVAYNLIIQTSESLMCADQNANAKSKPLQNIVVKVPPTCSASTNVPFNEVAAEIEKYMSSRPNARMFCSRSLSEISSTEDCGSKMKETCTLRDYLERNRPDFVENCSKRQDCLNLVNEARANERSTKRKLLSAQLADESIRNLSKNELRQLAHDLGLNLRRKKLAPKFISERDMKKHSERIYKSLPEVKRKQEEAKKESIKRTNLLMANIFKKNLQKKTLRGSVNLSNYSTLIKI